MRIDPRGPGAIGPGQTGKPTGADRAGGPTRPEKDTAAEGASAAEGVTSAEATAAAQAVHAAPDVRLDRIAEMRARLERGDLRIDLDKIAEGIIEGG